MNTLRAEQYLNEMPVSDLLQEHYDEDDFLQEACAIVFPQFEYPAFSHKTFGEIKRMVSESPSPVTSLNTSN